YRSYSPIATKASAATARSRGASSPPVHVQTFSAVRCASASTQNYWKRSESPESPHDARDHHNRYQGRARSRWTPGLRILGVTFVRGPEDLALNLILYQAGS